MDNKHKISMLAEISSQVSVGDMLETNIYTDQNWHLQSMHSFVSSVYPLSILNKSLLKDNVGSTNKINYDLDFSSELNKTSLKNINRKNINNINNEYVNKTQDYLHISYILNSIISKHINNDAVLAEKLKDIYDNYNEFKLIDIFLKVDKTKTRVPEILNTKMKKNILSHWK